MGTIMRVLVKRYEQYLQGRGSYTTRDNISSRNLLFEYYYLKPKAETLFSNDVKAFKTGPTISWSQTDLPKPPLEFLS